MAAIEAELASIDVVKREVPRTGIQICTYTVIYSYMRQSSLIFTPVNHGKRFQVFSSYRWRAFWKTNLPTDLTIDMCKTIPPLSLRGLTTLTSIDVCSSVIIHSCFQPKAYKSSI